MLAVFAAIALQAAAGSARANAPAPAPPDAAPAVSPADELAQLQQVYHEGCEVRAYGTYGDMCTSLADQIAQFRREMRRDESRRAREPRPTPAPPPPSPSPAPNAP